MATITSVIFIVRQACVFKTQALFCPPTLFERQFVVLDSAWRGDIGVPNILRSYVCKQNTGVEDGIPVKMATAIAFPLFAPIYFDNLFFAAQKQQKVQLHI